MKSPVNWLKGGFFAGIGLICAYYSLPILAKLALDFVTIVLCGVGVLAIWILLPAISEMLAQASFRLWELSIRAAPDVKLERGLIEHAKMIDRVETNIGVAITAADLFEQTLRDPDLTDADREFCKEQLLVSRQGIQQMQNERNNFLNDHKQLGIILKQTRAKLKMGSALKSLYGALSFSTTNGKEASAARIAVEEANLQLTESMSKLKVVMSRRQPIPIHQEVPLLTKKEMA